MIELLGLLVGLATLVVDVLILLLLRRGERRELHEKENTHG